LNGCIPFPVLQELAHQYHLTQGEEGLSSVVKEGIDKLEGGVVLEKFQEFVRPSLCPLRPTGADLKALFASLVLPL
jgi:hypothetical protein